MELAHVIMVAKKSLGRWVTSQSPRRPVLQPRSESEA